MVRRIANLVIAVVMACSLIGAGLTRGMSPARAAPSDMPAMGLHEHGCGPMASHEAPISPANPSQPACMTDLGCLLVVGITPTPIRVVEHVSWGPVTYWTQTRVVQGIAHKPILGPPIRPV